MDPVPYNKTYFNPGIPSLPNYLILIFLTHYLRNCQSISILNEFAQTLKLRNLPKVLLHGPISRFFRAEITGVSNETFCSNSIFSESEIEVLKILQLGIGFLVKLILGIDDDAVLNFFFVHFSRLQLKYYFGNFEFH